MNILMMTNTYLPHVGGVARSIERFSIRFRELGHQVKIVAPEFDHMPAYEKNVIRVPAIRHFNHTDFSMALPIPHNLEQLNTTFSPDVVHTHHPFLLGATALRFAHSHGLPLIFTHHTRYEDYTHNVPGDSPWMKRFVQKLATNYANLCDEVFVPSESIEKVIKNRGVVTSTSVVPTGVDMSQFDVGNGQRFRQRLGIPDDAFVIGHVGRLTAEKNMPFLVRSILRYFQSNQPASDVRVVIVGSGPEAEHIQSAFNDAGLSEHLFLAGVLGGTDLADAYHAMDVFAFASQSETQGMVLTEAMATGIPVVAVDAPGVRDVVVDRKNGCLIPTQDETLFANALAYIIENEQAQYRPMCQHAIRTAEDFSIQHTADLALSHYARLVNSNLVHRNNDYTAWVETVHLLSSEWELLKSTAKSASEAFDES